MEQDIPLCGGVFFGAGTYGCTFAPPLANATPILHVPGSKPSNARARSNSLLKNTLGKVMAKGDAEAEEKRNAFFRAADPEERVGIYARPLVAPVTRDAQALIASAGGAHQLDLCAAKSAAIGFALRVVAGTEDKNTERGRTRSATMALRTIEALRNSFSFTHAKEPYQIFMRRASTDMEHALANDRGNAAAFIPHLRALMTVFEAVQCYHAHGLVHLDFKTANIVVVPSSTRAPRECTLVSAKFDYRVIDFGLGRTRHEILDTQGAAASTSLGAAYYLYPLLVNTYFVAPRDYANTLHQNLNFEERVGEERFFAFAHAPVEEAVGQVGQAWLQAQARTNALNSHSEVLWMPVYDAVARLTIDNDSFLHTFAHSPILGAGFKRKRLQHLDASESRSREVLWAAARAADVYALALLLANVVYEFTGLQLVWNGVTKAFVFHKHAPLTVAIDYVCVLTPIQATALETLLTSMLLFKLGDGIQLTKAYQSTLLVFQ